MKFKSSLGKRLSGCHRGIVDTIKDSQKPRYFYDPHFAWFFDLKKREVFGVKKRRQKLPLGPLRGMAPAWDGPIRGMAPQGS